MSDAATHVKVTAASDIEVDREALDSSIKSFAGPNGAYYVDAFHKIHDDTGLIARTFNLWAAVLGPVWAASRAIWGMFWTFLILEIIAWVQIGRGLWGNLGSDFLDRAAQQQERMQERLNQAASAATEADAQRYETLANNMQRAIELNLLTRLW